MGQAKDKAKYVNEQNLRTYDYDVKMFNAKKADLEREVELTNKVAQRKV